MAGFLIYHEMLVDSFPLPPKKLHFADTCFLYAYSSIVVKVTHERRDRTHPSSFALCHEHSAKLGATPLATTSAGSKLPSTMVIRKAQNRSE